MEPPYSIASLRVTLPPEEAKQRRSRISYATNMTVCDGEDVLCCRMTNPSKLFSRLFIVAALGMFASAAAAEPSGCKECDRQKDQKEESVHREQIKADRAKYERENEKATARPWDGTNYDRSLPDKK